jgi:hypothetical protein
MLIGYMVFAKYHVAGDIVTVDQNVPATTTVATTSTSTATDEVTSNGFIMFSRPSDFGLALNKDQILVKSYIPSCDGSIDYCLYYNGDNYKGTSFGGAGLRIKRRAELKTVDACLTTSPAGYDGQKPQTVSTSSVYSVSAFPIGDAGMGHYASGMLYRLAYDGTCHEFETRISATQFQNSEPGTIKEFSVAMQQEIKQKLMTIVKDVKLANGQNVTFFQN